MKIKKVNGISWDNKIMSYFVKKFDGSVFEITDQERNDMLGKNGMLYFPSVDRTINSVSVLEVMSAKDYEIDRMMEKQKSQKTGVLHDGTPVFKHYGEWACYEDGTRYILTGSKEYPEIARDCVPTELEWETKYKLIPDEEERLKAILGHFQNLIEKTGEMKSTKELLSGKGI